jgi:ABC-type transporter Mla MlaB component
MTKEETRSNRLLSKVVRFVRHPTVNWSDLDSLSDEHESQYSKQALKEMLERKRQNDCVRKRDFDQLRKLRQTQQARSARPASVPDTPAVQASSFMPSLESGSHPGERAVTLRKIDEIEAQMSQQWWRGRQSADATTVAMQLPEGGNPAPSSFSAPPPGSTLPLLSEVVPEEVATQGLGAAFGLTRSMSPKLPPSLMGMHGLGGDSDFAPAFAPTEVSAPAKVNMVPPSFARFEHDVDLEEPAIVFANGDIESARASLQELIRRRTHDVPAQLPVWLALLDLYRAAGRHAEFEQAAIDFAGRFGRSAPQWFAMPLESGGLCATDAAAEAQGARWMAPALLTAQGVAGLQALQARSSGPWTLDWSPLEAIAPEAVPALEALAHQWADAPGQFVFGGASALLDILAQSSPSLAADVDSSWWHLRLAVLRLMNLPDDFELVALEYCVTYELSPPSWVDPVCRSSLDGQALALAMPMSFEDSMPSDAAWCEHAPQFALQGVIEGDALPWLASVQEKAVLGETVVIDCKHLVRMDFAAAGSVLNWASAMQSLGHVLQLSQLHQLVAVFFNVIGIQEHAQVIPRRD